MTLSDLVVDSQDPNRISHTKLWSNIAYAAATAVFIVQAWKGTLQPDVWFIYLGIVGTHTTASKFLSMKYGKATEEEPAK
jgi:hypothetical protein